MSFLQFSFLLIIIALGLFAIVKMKQQSKKVRAETRSIEQETVELNLEIVLLEKKLLSLN